MTFGENLKVLRNAHSVSQKELAQELGFTFQSVSKWERNESQPDIATLIELAKYFSTTIDALLGFTPEKQFATLAVEKDKAEIYSEYPPSETSVTGKILFAIDNESKIAGITYVPHMRAFKNGYIRNMYELFDERSTLIHEYTYRLRNEVVVDNKKIRIPEKGVVIAISDKSFASKQILDFIIPEEYSAFLNPDTHPGYYNSRNGKNLFCDILKSNELDDITVELNEMGFIFMKPSPTVDPISVNIETLAKIVRKELQKEHDKEIQFLKNRIEELEDMIEDSESNIDDLDLRVSEIETMISKDKK